MLKVLKLGVIGSLRSVKSVKPKGNWKPKKFKKSVKPNYRGVWKVLVLVLEVEAVRQLTS